MVNGVLYLACGIGLSVFLKSSLRYPFLPWYLLPFHNGTDVQRSDHKLVSSPVRIPKAPEVLEVKRRLLPGAPVLQVGLGRPWRELRQPPLGHSPFAPALQCKDDEPRRSLVICLDDLCCHSSYSVENAFKYNTQAVRESYRSKTNNVQRKRHTTEQRW